MQDSQTASAQNDQRTGPEDKRAERIRASLGARCIVLIGMMGAGKSSIGRRLANRLKLPFLDSDAEIELAAGLTIPEIFERHGEAAFRDGERRVIARLLESGPAVLATGGGAFLNPETQKRISEVGISVWLRAEADVLMRRVRKRLNRPLLRTPNPEATLRALIEARYPVYARADITVESRDAPHEVMVEETLAHLEKRLGINEASAAPIRASALAPSCAEIVRVDLGTRGYDILIGRDLIDDLGTRIDALASGARVAIVTDETVAGLHLPRAEAACRAAGIAASRIVVPPGESSKSWEMLERICDAILAARLERSDIVVALGGGVIGDLVGFAASILRRGMRFVQVPTTLLAQVDSSVGGKTAINSRHGKNLIGAFHQPSLVLADTALLDTLSEREFRAGYAEVVKYGLLGDAAFFDWLERHWSGIVAGKSERETAVAISCRAKAAIVARDEREDGERALLNLGHTFGHALERVTGYDSARLVHGEAVSIGMALACRFSHRLGLISGQEVTRVERHLHMVGLPTRLAEIPGGCGDASALLEAIAQDKKVTRGTLTFILLHGIGKAYIARGIDAAAIREFLISEGAAA